MSAAAKPCDCGRCAACVAVSVYAAGAPVAAVQASSGLCLSAIYEQLRASGVPSRRDYSGLAGRRFGRLVVVEPLGKDVHGHALWRCRCDCDGERSVTRHRLTRARRRVTACLACTNKRLRRAAA